MTNDILKLKEKFEALYPQYAKRLSAASEADFDDVYESILAEKRNEVTKALKANRQNAKCKGSDNDDYYAPITLQPDEYKRCINAEGSGIEAIVKELMNKMDVLKKCSEEGNNELFAAQLNACGLAAITPAGFTEFVNSLNKGEKIAAAILSGVVVVGLFTIMGVLELLVLAVLIPVFYMKKPAMAIIAVINELEEAVYYDSQYFNHGERVGITEGIPGAFILPSAGYYNLGFFTGSKKKNALYGVQGAYTLKDNNDTKYTFGFDCPLSSIHVDNNCYCGINVSAKDASKKTDNENKQDFFADGDKHGMSIKCNSPKGSYAYYIGRIFSK